MCLEALSEQSLAAHRVFVVDNSDDLPELAHPKLKLELIKPGKNLGFAAACNLAAKQSKSDWVAFLNPDAFPARNWLHELSQCVETHSKTICFSSKQVFYEAPHLLDGSGDNYHISGLYWRRGYKQAADRYYPERVFSASGAAMLVKRQIFLDLGGFDTDFFSYGEDVDFGFRLQLLNQPCLYCKDAQVFHRGYSSSGGRHSEFSLYYGHRNLVWVFFKNMPLPFLILFFPLHLVLTIITLIKFSLQGQMKTIFRAKWDAVKGLPILLKQRQRIQSIRKASLSSLWRAFTKNLNRTL